MDDGKIIGLIVLIFFAIAIPFNGWVEYGTARHVTAKVNHVENLVRGNGKGVDTKYMVYTDQGVFKDVDTMWYLKFDSSDIYGRLEQNKSYDFKVTGFRIPLLSMYPNIVSAAEVK